MITMEQWLGKNFNYAEVRVHPHSHGVRVTLYHNWKEICTGVQRTVEEAFQEALGWYDKNLERQRKEAVESMKRERAELQTKIENIDSELKKFLKPRRW